MEPENVMSLGQAVVVAPDSLTGLAARVPSILIEEIERRAGVRLPVVAVAPASGPALILGCATGPAEGFTVRTDAASGRVFLSGHDDRGLLYAAGHFLRALRTGPGRLDLPLPYESVTSPHWPLRGHQLGYRFLSNCYDGWDVPQFDRYIRDLALWGANAVELLPTKTGAPEESPHFPRPRLEMMAALSRVIDAYGLDVWVWWPALDGDYADPAVEQGALKDWAAVVSRLPRLDAIFVPGGDPGHTPPEVLFPYLEKQIASVRRFHPRCALWVSPQGFDAAQMEWFFAYLRDSRPAWLGGVVFGPWVNMELADFRARIPSIYPIRYYPDITHTRHCQYPVPDWDRAFALTQGREPTCPRPRGMAAILRLLQPHTCGALTYSEGAHDDVNKALWSALSWDPAASVESVLAAYACFFIGDNLDEPFAAGLLALEDNWRGPLAGNEGVERTFALFRGMEEKASPRSLTNWRFLQPLFRAYYDAYVRRRLLYETGLEHQALAVLDEVGETGSQEVLARAEAILDRAVTEPVERELRTRIFQLAEALFQTIHHKLSQPLYRALHTGRGAHLDSIDWPLNSAPWLRERFKAIRALPDENARIADIRALRTRTDPGPGGFYDAPGVVPVTPRLVRGPGPEMDPAFIQSPMTGFLYMTEGTPAVPVNWMTCACTLGGQPLEMDYEGLDDRASYAVTVVYGMPEYKARLSLEANGARVHDFIDKPDPMAPLTFDVPAGAVRGGRLRLTWRRDQSGGGAGYGLSVSEVMLKRKDGRA